MTAETQIEVLKALSAIETLSKNTGISVLLAPVESLPNIIKMVGTMKYKLSVIEGFIKS